MTSLPTIGWIGAGRMGVAMAGFIFAAGYPVLVCSRSASSPRTRSCEVAGRGRLAECARGADLVFSASRMTRARARSRWALRSAGQCQARRGLVDTSTVRSGVGRGRAGADKLGVPTCAYRSRVTPLRLRGSHGAGLGPQSAWDAVTGGCRPAMHRSTWERERRRIGEAGGQRAGGQFAQAMARRWPWAARPA